MSLDLATMITDGSARQPSKRRLLLIRIGVMAGLILFAPLGVILAVRGRRPTALDALRTRFREIGQTSRGDAMALLRSTFQQLVIQGAFAKLKGVEIAPFGNFTTTDVFSLYQFLYECEVSQGYFEEALTVLAVLPGRLDVTVLRQVDCLVALGRRGEAVALLERNLDLDGWRGKLRRRLRELGGRPLRAVP